VHLATDDAEFFVLLGDLEIVEGLALDIRGDPGAPSGTDKGLFF